jgi:hypothetical protein
MSENHLETCLYHLVGITEPVFKRLSATYDTSCIRVNKLEGKVAKTTLQILVMTLSIEGLLFFFAIFNITRASHLQKV